MPSKNKLNKRIKRIMIQPDPMLAGQLGIDGAASVQHRLAVLAGLVARGDDELRGLGWGVQEWCLIAEALSGHATMVTHASPDMGSSPVAAAAAIADLATYAGASLQWDCDAHQVSRQVSELSPPALIALQISIAFFWQNTEQIDAATPGWWTASYRRHALATARAD